MGFSADLPRIALIHRKKVLCPTELLFPSIFLFVHNLRKSTKSKKIHYQTQNHHFIDFHFDTYFVLNYISPAHHVPIMRVYSYDCTFDYTWEEVSTANWLKYCPWNQKSSHVIAVDTLSREVDQSTGIVLFPLSL